MPTQAELREEGIGALRALEVPAILERPAASCRRLSWGGGCLGWSETLRALALWLFRCLVNCCLLGNLREAKTEIVLTQTGPQT